MRLSKAECVVTQMFMDPQVVSTQMSMDPQAERVITQTVMDPQAHTDPGITCFHTLWFAAPL